MDPFVDPGALTSLGPIRYLDARDQAAFEAGHAPGAVRVPLDAWDKAAKAADIGFSANSFWDGALGSLGVGPSVTAVAYDTGAMTNAARVWFVLQYFGVKCVILNGGWPVLAGASGLPAAANAAAGSLHATAGSGAVGVIDRETLKPNSMAPHMCSTAARARSSPARTRATGCVADTCRARDISPTSI